MTTGSYGTLFQTTLFIFKFARECINNMDIWNEIPIGSLQEPEACYLNEIWLIYALTSGECTAWQ